MTRFTLIRVSSLALVLAAGACGDDEDDKPSDSESDAGRCDPGDYESCTCKGGAKGTQMCDSKGKYGDCVCGEETKPGEFVCKAGDDTYPYDFGGGDECNECAVDNCCASFAACERNTACACYWKCLADPDSGDDCLTPCKLTDFPDAFVDHAACLSDSCLTPCDLKP